MILEDARNQKNVKVSTAHACSHDWHASSNAPQCSHAKSRHRPRPHPRACSIGGQTTRRRGDNLVEKVLALQGTRRQGDGAWIPSRLFCPGGMWIPSRFFCPGGMYLTSTNRESKCLGTCCKLPLRSSAKSLLSFGGPAERRTGFGMDSGRLVLLLRVFSRVLHVEKCVPSGRRAAAWTPREKKCSVIC